MERLQNSASVFAGRHIYLGVRNVPRIFSAFLPVFIRSIYCTKHSAVTHFCIFISCLLISCFRTSTNVRVCVSVRQQMKGYIRSVADDESLRDDQCFVMFVMSHGKMIATRNATGELIGSEYVYGADGEMMSTNSLLAPLTNDNCRHLSGKPKLVFFQACRGGAFVRSTCLSLLADRTLSPCDQ
jgi:hypothetical protein